jgi:hypothetical protein
MLLMVGMFLLPPVAAALLYFVFPEWIPTSTTNYGQLVTPSRTIPALTLVDAAGSAVPSLGGKWTLVYLAGPECEDSCKAQLYLTRQVRKALDKDSLRVQRVYLAPDRASLVAAQALLAVDHHDLLMYADEGSPGARASDFFQPDDPHTIYLVDPVGNWMMIYSDKQAPGGKLEPKGIYKDLKRLLRTSHIG